MKTYSLTPEMRSKLSDSPLLIALSDEQKDRFFGAGEVLKFEKGEGVVEKNSMGDSLFLIVDGRVRILGPTDKEITTLSGEESLHEQYEGDFFGEMSVLDHEPRSATAVAADNLTLLRIDKVKLFELFESDTELQVVLLTNMGRILSRRIRRSNVRLGSDQ